MAYAHQGPDWVRIDGAFTIAQGEREGQSAPANFPDSATPEELEDAGIVLIEDTDPPEDWTLRVTGHTLADVDGVPTVVWLTEEIELADLLTDRLAAAEAIYDQMRQRPVAWDFAALEGLDDDGVSVGAAGEQTLQMRDSGGKDDPKNWLGAAAGAMAAVGAGFPNLIQPLKTTDNIWVQTTATQVLAVLLIGDGAQTPVLGVARECLVAYGAVKKALTAAEDAQALAAVDLTDGYPD